MGKCKICGKNADSEYCFKHKKQKPLKKTMYPYNPMPLNTNAAKAFDKALKRQIMWEFFLEIWMKRPHFSIISGAYLGDEPLSLFFHHVLPKNKYPEAQYDEENIVLLTSDEHVNIESDMYKDGKINKKRELLKTKYKL